MAGLRFASLLACTLIFLCTLELATRFGFRHVSKMERRHATEFAAASSIVARSGQPSVLVVGNSLLLEGVDFTKLSASMPVGDTIQRFALEDTGLLEWQFGIRRLIAAGSRPSHIILALGVPNFSSNTMHTDYSVFYLLRVRDLPDLASRLHYDRTQAADLYFARLSLFFAGRNLIRNFVLNLIAPSYATVLHGLAVADNQPKRHGDLRAPMVKSLLDTRRSCDSIGAQLIVLIMPGFSQAEASDVVAAAHRAGVAVLEPVAEGAFPQRLFRDGFHLNAEGSQRFTALLTPEIIAHLGPHHD
jgi:hypothetical protein